MASERFNPPTALLPLGVLIYDDGLDADLLLGKCAEVLSSLGYRLGGVIQTNPTRPERRRCDMDLADLLSGEQIRISYDRGNEAKGCRLDPAAFAQADVWVKNALGAGVDLLIINKFGKQEAQGRGLRSAIADALLSNIPVLIGVSRQNLEACAEFAGGEFAHLNPDLEGVVEWCRQAMREAVPHVGSVERRGSLALD